MISLNRKKSFARTPVLLGLLLAGCASTEPEVRVVTALPRGTDPPIFVTAARQKETIVRALRDAGFQVVERPDETPYLLRATVGVDQGERPCGTLNNIRFALRADGKDLMVVEKKGWSGSCTPNVFDEASVALRRRVVEIVR